MMSDDLSRAPQEKGLKLLIVDDEQPIRTKLGELCTQLGFEVSTAEDGMAGWEVFQKVNPDIVILDIYMPLMNGLMLMHKIKGERSECPVILITGFLHYEQLVKQSKAKPDGFILKPFHREKISSLVQRLVKERQEQTD